MDPPGKHFIFEHLVFPTANALLQHETVGDEREVTRRFHIALAIKLPEGGNISLWRKKVYI